MTRKKTTLDHHLMISMICEYNSFRDYASRPQTQQNEDIAAFCAIRAFVIAKMLDMTLKASSLTLMNL